MANVRFSTGNLSSLPSNLTEGRIYFTFSDENNNKGKIIFDRDNSHRYIMAASPSATVAFATCDTDGLTAEKEIIIRNNDDWLLEEGSSLFVKFLKSNIQSNPTFTVYSPFKIKKLCENKEVYCEGVRIVEDSINCAGSDSRIIHYVYDGNVFHFMGWSSVGSLEYDVATSSTKGLIKPWVSHSAPANGPAETADDKVVTVNDISSVEGRYYALEMDSEGRGFVNVPWKEGTANKHALHIGPFTYDGSEEVTVITYNGRTNSEN